MKTLPKFAAVAVAIGSLTMAAHAGDNETVKACKSTCCADEKNSVTLLSPKALSLRSTMVAGVNSDPDLLQGRYPLGTAKQSEAKNTVVVNSTKRDPDLLAAVRNSVRSPKTQEQLGSRTAEFEIAPMK